MKRSTLLTDAAIAAILTILVVVLSPGLAVVGLLAILVVLVCAVSFALDRRRGRRTRSRPARRPPSLRGLDELEPAARDQRGRRQPARSSRSQSRRPPPRRR